MFIQANIGRNFTVTATNGPATATNAMKPVVWEMFQGDVKDEIFLAVHDVNIEVSIGIEREDFQVHTGTGEWEGVKEESAHVSVYFDTKPGQVNAARLQEHLSDRLAALAREYGQDAIAFMITDSHLATPNAPTHGYTSRLESAR